MKVDDLINQKGEWLKGTGPEGDVIVSSRVRLARNLNRFPFPGRANDSVRREVEEYLRSRVEKAMKDGSVGYFPMSGLDPVDRQVLMERHLVSRDHAMGNHSRGVAISRNETASVMVNEEDHLRLQVLRSGLQLSEAWAEIDQIDSALDEEVQYAYHPQFGYLTSCPTNVGTGLRISVLMHLPAAVFSKQMDKVLQSLQRLNYSVRGFYGEGTSPIGDFFQISNQVTLGKAEEEIVRDLQRVIPEILKFERSWRLKLLREDSVRLNDKVWRAYGILKNARKLTSDETMDFLSAMRLGAHLGVMQEVSPHLINELFIYTQPGHLQTLEGRVLEPEERDVVRAEYLRKQLP
jgi:protein arginine kinase